MPNSHETPKRKESKRPLSAEAEKAKDLQNEVVSWETTVTNEQVQRIFEETEDPAIAFAKVLEQYPALREVMKEDYYARSVRGILWNVSEKQEAFGDKLPRFLEMIGKYAYAYTKKEIDAACLKQRLEHLRFVSNWTPPAIKKYLKLSGDGIDTTITSTNEQKAIH
jgi:hypothetical protein